MKILLLSSWPRLVRRLGISVGLLLATSHRSAAQSTSVTVVRQLYGNVGVEVQRVPPLAVRVGVADSSQTLTVSFIASDVVRWADSATRVLDAVGRAKDSTRLWQAVVSEPGINSGSIAVAKAITGKDTTITVLVADTDFNQMRFTLDDSEARAFIAVLRRVARSLQKKGPASRRQHPNGANRAGTESLVLWRSRSSTRRA
jgi:hypothetical protein